METDGYFFLRTVDFAASAAFFFWLAVTALTFFWVDFFWFAFGDRSPIGLIVFRD